MIKGLPKIYKREDLRSNCVTSKRARAPFPSSTKYRASKELELIYCDLCGPFALEPLGGSKYFLLLVYDCTRMLSVSTMKQKLEAFEALKNFKIQVEKEKDLKIVCLRIDNGGEFTSNVFSSCCIENGIKRQYSTPYTPQKK